MRSFATGASARKAGKSVGLLNRLIQQFNFEFPAETGVKGRI